MTEGETLAKALKAQLTLPDRTLLKAASEDFRDGFLIARFGQDHSRVALYNASANWED